MARCSTCGILHCDGCRSLYPMFRLPTPAGFFEICDDCYNGYLRTGSIWVGNIHYRKTNPVVLEKM